MSKLTDKIAFINPQAAVQSAFAAVSAIQSMPSQDQVMGAALLFSVIADQTGISVSELLDKAKRIEKDADTFHQREVKALRDYVRGELK